MSLSHTYLFPFHSVSIASSYFPFHPLHIIAITLITNFSPSCTIIMTLIGFSCIVLVKRLEGAFVVVFPRFHSIRLIIISIFLVIKSRRLRKRRFSLRASIFLKKEANKGKVNLCPFCLSLSLHFSHSSSLSFPIFIYTGRKQDKERTQDRQNTLQQCHQLKIWMNMHKRVYTSV